jgi:hypothetical protein
MRTSPEDLTPGIRYYRTDRFGSSVPRLIRLPKNSEPTGTPKESVHKVFGIGYFGSIPVFTENIEPACSRKELRLSWCSVFRGQGYQDPGQIAAAHLNLMQLPVPQRPGGASNVEKKVH